MQHRRTKVNLKVPIIPKSSSSKKVKVQETIKGKDLIDSIENPKIGRPCKITNGNKLLDPLSKEDRVTERRSINRMFKKQLKVLKRNEVAFGKLLKSWPDTSDTSFLDVIDEILSTKTPYTGKKSKAVYVDYDEQSPT